MELLIRSQDREKLFKFDGLVIYCTCEEMPSTASYEICDSFEGSIATYKTKERALEVLDEIQNILILKDMYKYDRELVLKSWENVDAEQVKIVRDQMSVYKMPKE